MIRKQTSIKVYRYLIGKDKHYYRTGRYPVTIFRDIGANNVCTKYHLYWGFCRIFTVTIAGKSRAQIWRNKIAWKWLGQDREWTSMWHWQYLFYRNSFLKRTLERSYTRLRILLYSSSRTTTSLHCILLAMYKLVFVVE